MILLKKLNNYAGLKLTEYAFMDCKKELNHVRSYYQGLAYVRMYAHYTCMNHRGLAYVRLYAYYTHISDIYVYGP